MFVEFLSVPRWTTRGGGALSYICILLIRYVLHKRPPFSALNFSSRAYHFHKLQNISFRSITILVARQLHLFAVPDTIVFKISFPSSRSSTPTTSQSTSQMRPSMGNAQTFSQYLVPENPLIPTKSVPECPILLVLETPIFTLENVWKKTINSLFVK